MNVERGERIIQDEAVIEKIIAGDEQAFRLLITRYRNYLFRVTYSVLHHQKDAEDVTQEAFIQIYHSLPQYQSQGLKTWMTRIAVNKAIDYKRKWKRGREDLTQSMEDVFQEAKAESNVEIPLLNKEKKEQIRRHINQLPAGYRDVVVAYYMEEKTYREIAIEQRVEVKTVESRLYRARKWLRKHWKEEDFR